MERAESNRERMMCNSGHTFCMRDLNSPSVAAPSYIEKDALTCAAGRRLTGPGRGWWSTLSSLRSWRED